jgi:antitoxin HicB
MKKDFDYYMTLPYTIEILPEQPDGWYAGIKELPGCMTTAETAEEALTEIQELKEEWIRNAIEDKFEIPEPRAREGYSGNFRMRIPKSLHRKLVETADEEEVSLNTLCVAMLSEAFGSRSEKSSLLKSEAQDKWQEAVLQLCKVEKLDVGAQDPEIVLAGWLQKEITAAVQRKQGEMLYHISRMLGLLGEASPLMHVVADMLMQMRAALQDPTEKRPVEYFSSLDDQIFSEIEEEKTEFRTIRRIRSPSNVSTTALERSDSVLIDQFSAIVNAPKKR